jgi:type I restriction enzyme, R subunit
MLAEQDAKQTIDKLLSQAGWAVQTVAQADIHAARGVAIREIPLLGRGIADHPLSVDPIPVATSS